MWCRPESFVVIMPPSPVVMTLVEKKENAAPIPKEPAF